MTHQYDDDDDMMMLDGSEFEPKPPQGSTSAATSSAVPDAADTGRTEEERSSPESSPNDAEAFQRRFFDYSSGSEEEEVMEKPTGKRAVHSESSDEDLHAGRDDDDDGSTDGDEEDSGSRGRRGQSAAEDLMDATLPPEILLQRTQVHLAKLTESVRGSMKRLNEAMGLQMEVAMPVFSPWLFSSETTRGSNRSATASSGPEAEPKADGTISTPTEAECGYTRVIGASRLKTAIQREVQAHLEKYAGGETLRAKVGLSLEQHSKSGTSHPQETCSVFDASHLQALRGLTNFARCSVAPYFHLLTETILSDALSGVVAIKHWVHPPTSKGRHLQGRPRDVPAAAATSGAAAAAPTIDGAEIDVIGSKGLRWFKIRASKSSGKSLEEHIRRAKKVQQEERESAVEAGEPDVGASKEDPPLIVVDAQLAKLVTCARDSATNCCPYGTTPEVYLVIPDAPSPFLTRYMKKNGIIVKQIAFNPFTTLMTDDAGKESPTVDRSDTPPAASGSQTTSMTPSLILEPLGWEPRLLIFDVTALVALCSDTCNGAAGFDFPNHNILQQQSHSEFQGERACDPILVALQTYTRDVRQLSPVHSAKGPTLADELASWPTAVSTVPAVPEALAPEYARISSDESWTRGSSFTALMKILSEIEESIPKQYLNWAVATTAWLEFCWILNTVAGAAEFRRAAKLAEYLRVVGQDELDPSCLKTPILLRLQESSKIHRRHREVFGISEAVGGLTLTATRQFVHAALEQGISLGVVFHPSRALTERKRLSKESPDSIRKVALAERKERQKAERASRKEG